VTRGSSIGLAVAERFAAEGATAAFATLDEITPEHFDQIFSVNVPGHTLHRAEALPLLNQGASIHPMTVRRKVCGPRRSP
jgi:NAD(P)-dependent dehydrogenase (short-subunit alcohol dehydrogenase family)